MSAATLILFTVAITLTVLLIAIAVGYTLETLASREETRRRNQAHKDK